ncbi:MAG: alpha/beta fold hydrolase, partial [Geminicoccales bacterium]
MSSLINADIAFGDEALRGKISPDHHRADASIASNADVVTADDWFALGARVLYDRHAKEILQPGGDTGSPDVVQVFRRIAYAEAVPEGAIWTSFLPGWPDGSFGWAKVDQQLTGETSKPRLYVEYVGHGDSDKPLDYPYGTMERADLVEALWKAEGIT